VTIIISNKIGDHNYSYGHICSMTITMTITVALTDHNMRQGCQ